MRHPKHGWGVVVLGMQLGAAAVLVVACAEQPTGVDARIVAPNELRHDTYPVNDSTFFPPLHLSSTQYHVLNTEIGDTALTHSAPSKYGNEIHQFDTQWHNTKTEWWLYKDSTFRGPIKHVDLPVGTVGTEVAEGASEAAAEEASSSSETGDTGP